MFVLDTNTVLDYFNGKGKVAERLLATPRARSPSRRYPLMKFGWSARVAESQAASRAVRGFPVCGRDPALDAEAGMRAAELRHYLERSGEVIGPLDTLIAAIAFAHGSVLVTRNLREFSRVPGLETVNWHD